MADEDSHNGPVRPKRRRRRRRWAWAGVAALLLLPLAALWVMMATQDDENIVLSRNEVVSGASGERVWRGTYWNHSDSLYTDLDVVLLFVDGEGMPVGQVRGGADRLDPGEVFHLEAPLPAGATRIQMHQLRWTTYGTRAVLGPWRPWAFGYVQDEGCGDLRLSIGSCTPMRERE